jgi:hypothetical protein
MVLKGKVGLGNEATISIEGVELSYAESLTVRVALSSFLSDMAHNGLGSDSIGKSIAEGYLRNGRRVESLLIKSINEALDKEGETP